MNIKDKEKLALLALLASPGSDADRIEVIDWPALDWEAMLTSVDNNIFPYMHFMLDGRGIRNKIPNFAWDVLASSREATRLRHLRWTSEIKRITKTFEEAEVPFLLLKGGDLKLRLYPDPSTRPIRDVDILIAPENLALAISAVERAGFIARFNPNEETRKWQNVKFYKQCGKERLMLELHCRSESTPTNNTLEWNLQWNRSLLNELSPDCSVRVLAPCDLLPQLSLHFIYHHSCERGLLWLLDIRLLLERWHDVIDWGQLKSECEANGSASVVELALGLSSRLLGTPAVDGFMGKVPDSDMEEMFILASEQLFHANLESRPPGLFNLSNSKQLVPYVLERLQRWKSQEWMNMRGSQVDWWLMPGLMSRRAWRHMKHYYAAWKGGGMKQGVKQRYQETDAKSLRLKALLAR